MKEKYVNPLTDFGFKKLFGTEPNKALLLDFLNTLLPVHHRIKNLHYVNSEQLPLQEGDRAAVFDIYCKSITGEHFIVELQRVKQKHFKERSVYYSSFPIQKQGKKGKSWDFQLKAVYTISILDFKFEEHKMDKTLTHQVKLKDEQGRLFYDKLTYIYIELPKFEVPVEELETKFEKWLYVFKHLAHLQEKPKKLQERIFKRLFKAAEIAKFTPMELSNYEASLKTYRDNKNTLDYATELATLEGRKEGHKEGHAEGKLEGKIEGKLEMIKNLLAIDMPIEQIVSISGLPQATIEKLLKDTKDDL